MQHLKTPKRVRWGLWLPTAALTVLCGLTGVSGRSAAWALTAVRQARAFGEALLPPRPAAHPLLSAVSRSLAVNTASSSGATARLVSAGVAGDALGWRPLLAVPGVMAPDAPVGTIRYAPRPGYEKRMVGGRFQGSNDGVSYTTLYTVTHAPPAGQWTTATVPVDLTQYRYLRYLAPNGAYGNIAELEFDSNGVKLTGTGYGTPGSYANHGNTFAMALDGSLSTSFDAPTSSIGAYVGIDRGPTGFTVSASPATVTGITTSLTVRWNRPAAGSPSYAWSATGPAAVTFSGGGSPTTAATFRQAGAYTLTVHCSAGASYSGSVAVTVRQTLTGLAVSPATATVTTGRTQQFAAAGADQFGNPMTASPRFSVSGGGTMSAAGLFTAATAGPSYAVTASSGNVSARAAVSVQAPAPPAAPAPNAATVQLPIEVMGADGTTASVPVSVPASVAVAGLWLEAHNLSYPDKASVQVNGGAWVPLDNATVQVAEPGKGYGGIGGGFSTLKMTLPLAAEAVHAGTNTLSFRFNHTDGVSSGFRILAFNFLDADGQPVLPASAFTEDDPDTWQPPLTDAQDIAAGKSLWQSGRLLQSSIALSPIKAACANCHADDGMDLKYFNYSNYSIIQRAEFHGLSAAQGAQIASYIRTLDVPNPGRPWNPPYQPGPSLDSRPVEDWAAGAGVDAVLDKSSDMLPYLFPSTNGVPNSADIAADKDLDARELPVPLLLPDWNHWLPPVWPGDIPNGGFATSMALGQYDGSPSYKGITVLALAAQAQAHPTQANLQTLAGFMGGWQRQIKALANSPAVNPSESADGRGISTGSIPLTPQTATQVYSVGLWGRVKEWNVMQKFDLDDMGTTLYGTTTKNGLPINGRVWLTGGTFETAPAFLGIYGGSSGANVQYATLTPSVLNVNQNPLSLSPLVPGTPQLYQELEGNWYWLQFILDDGDRSRAGNNPIDWGYLPGTIEALGYINGTDTQMMYYASVVKMMQQFNNGVAPDQANPSAQGWDIRESDPGYLLNFTTSSWGDTPTATKTALATAYLGAWLPVAEQYAPAQYYTQGAVNSLFIHAGETTAEVSQGYGGSPDAGEALYHSVPYFDRDGIDPSLVNEYVGWLQNLMPDVDFTHDR